MRKKSENYVNGQIFLYFGPRKLPLLRRGTFVGKILDVDSNEEVVHIRTYLPSENNNQPKVDIAHIPIGMKAFSKSIQELGGVSEVHDGDLTAVHEWKKKFVNGVAGFFTQSIYKAEMLSWGVVLSQDSDINNMTHYLLTAYPKANEHGRFSILVVEPCMRGELS